MLRLRTANLGGKKRLWRLSAIVGLTLVYGWMLMKEIVSIREVGIFYVMAGVSAAYVKYCRRKLVVEFKRYTDTQLKQQARKFRGELLKTIQGRAWGDDELDALISMAGEFFKISPFDWSRHSKQVENKTSVSLPCSHDSKLA